MKQDEHGGLLILGVVSLLSISSVVVMTVGTQAGGVRSAQASVLTGRRLTGLAESAVAEAQAELGRLLAGDAAGSAARSLEPRRTRALIGSDYRGTAVSDVRIRRVRYDRDANLGEVELSATASARTLGRTLVRTVVQRFHTSLGPDRRTIDVAEVAHAARVDCEGE